MASGSFAEAPRTCLARGGRRLCTPGWRRTWPGAAPATPPSAAATPAGSPPHPARRPRRRRRWQQRVPRREAVSAIKPSNTESAPFPARVSRMQLHTCCWHMAQRLHGCVLRQAFVLSSVWGCSSPHAISHARMAPQRASLTLTSARSGRYWMQPPTPCRALATSSPATHRVTIL